MRIAFLTGEIGQVIILIVLNLPAGIPQRLTIQMSIRKVPTNFVSGSGTDRLLTYFSPTVDLHLAYSSRSTVGQQLVNSSIGNEQYQEKK